MGAGLFGLLDDIAPRWRDSPPRRSTTSAQPPVSESKAAGVVVDDTAVTPQYVSATAGSASCRSSGRSHAGHCATSCLFILPAALLS